MTARRRGHQKIISRDHALLNGIDPILDVRALEALGVATTVPYTLPFWSRYVAVCRKIDDETGYGMRTIDRALWQWSKEDSERRETRPAPG